MCLLLVCIILPVNAQDSSGVVTRAIIVNGDTLPIVALNEVDIFGPVVFASKLEAISFSRLVLNVKMAYPYARIVAAKSQEYDLLIASATSKKEKKNLMKKAEDELKAQFEDDAKNMNEEEGKLLFKLIYRQTGSSAYDLIKSYRGGLTAIFYQTFGRLYGYNLKSTYDASGEDKEIEKIVVMIEKGEI